MSNLQYISNLSKDAIIQVNQDGKDWLSKVSQITAFSSQEIQALRKDLSTSISNVRNELLGKIDDSLLGYVSQTQLDETVQDIKAKTDEQIRVTLWHYAKKSDIDEIIELDYLINYYTKEEITDLLDALQININKSANKSYSKSEIDSIISVLNNKITEINDAYSSLSIITGKVIESVNKTVLNNYYTKTEVDSLVNGNEYVRKSYVDDAIKPFETHEDHVKDIQNSIQTVKGYINEQFTNTLPLYIKKNEVDKQLNIIKDSLTNTLNIKFTNYYTKKEIDKKFNDIGKAYVQILSPREYQVMKAYGQLHDNNLYLIQKYGRPIELYIGKFLFAKRSDDTAIGFPYTFPLVF